MENTVERIRKIIDENDNIVIISGLNVELENGMNGVRAEHLAYDIEDKYGYDNEEIISSPFYARRSDIFYDYYKNIILSKKPTPSPIHERSALLDKAGKLDGVVTRTVYSSHEKAGCRNVVSLNGSVEENTCPVCGKVYGSEFVKNAKGIPHCENCNVAIRPGFTLLGEMVDNGRMTKACNLVENANVLLLVGTAPRSSLCRNILKYYEGDKMIIINTSEQLGDEVANYRIYGNLAELFEKVTDVDLTPKEVEEDIEETEEAGEAKEKEEKKDCKKGKKECKCSESKSCKKAASVK